MNKLLTIIIPMYNVSQYINQCLDSLVEDRSILDELEIIVVNDGSTDDSGVKAQVYAEKYPQSVILINKENGGHGSALNVGIEKATGRYLRALDSDDWVKPDGLAKQIEFIRNQKNEVDMIINPSEDIWVNRGTIELRGYEKLKNYRSPFALEVLTENRYFPFFWNASMRTQLYRENDVPKIDEGIFYDDIEFYIYILPFIKTITFLPDIIYQYRCGTPGQSMNPRNKIKRQWMYEKVMQAIYNYRKVGGEARKLIDIRLTMMIGEDLNLYLLWDDTSKAKKEFLNIYQKYKDIPVLKYTKNKKLKFLVATNFIPFNIVSIFFTSKHNKKWRQ